MSQEIAVEKENIGLPDEDTMSEEYGLVENPDYVDARGWDLEGYERLLEEECEIVEWAESGGDLGSQAAYDQFEGWEAWCTGIDPGLICTVMALSVVGCCPFTSCIGGQSHSESHPVVGFWCTQEVWPLIKASAAATGCSLRGCDSPGIILYHEQDWRPLRAFGAELIERWKLGSLQITD